ncbi:glycosyltransferase family 2 protein [Candidatus Collierbacteria bacterium]|nr:glycosyltransferase family 2 protein [Candidatus Collierbacteria bacterium]
MKDISVVIPVYNEEKVIGRCLESLAGQTLKPKEVIIVDDGSTDGTEREVEIATGRTGRYTPRNDVVVLRQKHLGAGAARNLGTKHSTGDILVFVDADMIFSRTFLADLVKPIQEGKSKGTFSKLEYVVNWNNRFSRFWNYAKGIYEPRSIPVDYPETAPVFRAILRTEFDRAGGFDENKGYNDDWSLSEKLGTKATETKARFYHYNPENLSEAFIQARWAGKRNYKFGILGGLIKEFPLWAVGAGVIKAIRGKGKVSEGLLSLLTLYPLFLLVIKSAATIGVIEFTFKGKPSK